MPFSTPRSTLFLLLTGFFITNAVVAEMIGGKLIALGPFVLSIGIIPWPIVFVTTDLINEYYGKATVRRLSILTAGLISYAFILLLFAIWVPAASFSPVTPEQFNAVFGQSMWIIVGSITAFLLGQLIDATLFHQIRQRTGEGKLWMRATGSTVVSQFVDTFVVSGIAFLLPGKITFGQFIQTSLTGYSFKLIVAILMTPVIYAAHAYIDRRFGISHSATAGSPSPPVSPPSV